VDGEVMNGARLLTRDGVRRLLVTIRRPWETELQLRDLDGEVLATETLEAGLYDLGDHGDSLWMYATSRRFKVDMFRLSLDGPDTFSVHPFFSISEEDAERLVHCEIERIQVETFDGRMLHAYLSTPRQAPAEGQPHLAVVVAFYGGGNYFDWRSQVYCEAGITHLSAATRGSWGFGQEFYALNDGDLGGDEIVDLHYVAQWLVDERGFSPRDIGVTGGSHGGYATMRALTFPPETNDRNSDFDWGWGVSFFGFSDIRTFWETCNIPDWVLLEAGNPETEPDKIRDRSPLYHLDRLDSPILLLHGENDQRVPVAESRQFAAACETAEKDCTYIEFEGQGHGLKGVRNQVRVWKSVFAFLETAVVQ
jgi:dipeptidyl aminopeptidase/acylaminoacyl peptidase